MKNKWIIGLLIFLIATIAVVFIRTWNGELPYPSSVQNMEHRGQFGDSFAVFGAIVSALGFIGILITLVLQQIQLSHQASELIRQAQRDEENRVRDERNQYEQLLFRLLDLYQASVESIRSFRNQRELTGLDALSDCLERMQKELRRRKLHFIPPRELSPILAEKATDAQKLLFDYVTIETCRVIQYTVTYQRRMISTLQALLTHLEERCPPDTSVETYRDLVSSQITHIETQYIFAIVLIYAREERLRNLLIKSGLFSRDSAPYNFKLHRVIFSSLWGAVVGDPSQARKLAFSRKAAARIRESAKKPPLSLLLTKYSISSPVTPESIAEESAAVIAHPPSDFSVSENKILDSKRVSQLKRQ